MVASWINPRSADVAVTMGGSHFLLSAIEFVVECDGRYFLHMADDSFSEVTTFTFDTWKGRHADTEGAVQPLATPYYERANLSDDWPEGANDADVTMWVRASCVVAVAKRQRSRAAYVYEVYTALGYTVPVESAACDLCDALVPPQAAIGKFLVWDYEPRMRRYSGDVWVVAIKCGAVETAKVMDRLDMAFVDVYFTNGVHYLLDVIVDPARVPDIEASFLTATPQPQSQPKPSSPAFHSLFM